MSNIVKFLEDRLNEDELAASEAEKKHTFWDSVFHPVRALREVAAKRALMALHQAEQVEYLDGDGQDRMSTDCTTCDTCGCADTWPCDTLRLLAAPYADHPDHNPAWNVNVT